MVGKSVSTKVGVALALMLGLTPFACCLGFWKFGQRAVREQREQRAVQEEQERIQRVALLASTRARAQEIYTAASAHMNEAHRAYQAGRSDDARSAATRARAALEPVSRVLSVGPDGRPGTTDSAFAFYAGALVRIENFVALLDAEVPAWAASSTAPSVRELEVEFNRLEAPSATRSNASLGTLVCRVGVGNDNQWGVPWDLLGSADLRVKLSINGGPERVEEGADDSNTTIVRFAEVPLTAGTQLRFSIADRDGNEHSEERVGSVTFTIASPPAFPLHESAGQGPGSFSLRCHPLERERIAEVLRSFDEIANVPALQQPPTEPLSPGWFPSVRLGTARANLQNAANVLGWRHPELRSRVRALDTMASTHLQQLDTALRALSVAPTVSAPVGGVRIEVLRWGCGAAMASVCNNAATSCAVQLQVVGPRRARIPHEFALVSPTQSANSTVATVVLNRPFCAEFTQANTSERFGNAATPVALAAGAMVIRMQ